VLVTRDHPVQYYTLAIAHSTLVKMSYMFNESTVQLSNCPSVQLPNCPTVEMHICPTLQLPNCEVTIML